MDAYRPFQGAQPGGGVRIVNAATEDESGVPATNSISLDLTRCLYYSASTGFELAGAFTYYLNGVVISKTGSTPSPASNNPLSQRWETAFAAGAIATARGAGDDAWGGGDVLTVELTTAFSDLMQIRPDCIFANIDLANDKPANSISQTPVRNLYDTAAWLTESGPAWVMESGPDWNLEN